jgi:uncharacterized protein
VNLATVAWRSDAGAEWCTLEGDGERFSLRGEAIVAERSLPYLVSYAVELGPGWETREVVVEAFDGRRSESVRLLVQDGTWVRDGGVIPDLAGCLDVDLAFTPATNTLPIRRLALGVGDAAEVEAAWVRWPQLDVVRAHQRYERLAEDRYRFTQDDFRAEITVDSEGLVTEYADIWRAIGRA